LKADVKNLPVKTSVLAALSFVISLASCASNDESPGHSFRIYEENGVQVAETTGGPKYMEPLFEYEEVVRLEQDEEREETILYQAYSYLMGEDSCFYVEDRGNTRIAIFGPDGKYIRSIGREGEGPGEFRNLRLLWIRGNNLAIWDSRNRRTSLFNTGGAFLKSFSHSRGGSSISELHPIPNGRMVLVSRERDPVVMGEEDEVTWYSATIVSSEGDTLTRVESQRYNSGKIIFLADYNIAFSAQIYFGPRSQILFHPENGILNYLTTEPILKWYGINGELNRLIRLEIRPEPVTKEDRLGLTRMLDEQAETVEEGSFLDEEGWRALAKEQKKYLKVADNKSFWRSVTVDDLGYYWLRYHPDYNAPAEERSNAPYRVLSPEGEYLGDTVWPETNGRVSRGHFLTFHEDVETGLRAPVVYRIRPAVAGLEYP